MAVLRLNASEFARYHRQLANRFRPAIVRGVHSGAARACQFLAEATRTAPPANPAGIGTGGAVNTGTFLRGWRWYGLNDGAVVVNATGYGPIVDGGRQPGTMPPRRAIQIWAMRRLRLSEAEAWRASWPIGMAIKRRGLIGRNILSGNTEHILRLCTYDVIHELEYEMSRPPRRGR